MNCLTQFLLIIIYSLTGSHFLAQLIIKNTNCKLLYVINVNLQIFFRKVSTDPLWSFRESLNEIMEDERQVSKLEIKKKV